MQRTHHLCGGLGMLRGDVLLQGRLREAHLAAVGTCERLGLLYRKRVSTVIQVCKGRERKRNSLSINAWRATLLVERRTSGTLWRGAHHSLLGLIYTAWGARWCVLSSWRRSRSTTRTGRSRNRLNTWSVVHGSFLSNMHHSSHLHKKKKRGTDVDITANKHLGYGRSNWWECAFWTGTNLQVPGMKNSGS